MKYFLKMNNFLNRTKGIKRKRKKIFSKKGVTTKKNSEMFFEDLA